MEAAEFSIEELFQLCLPIGVTLPGELHKLEWQFGYIADDLDELAVIFFAIPGSQNFMPGDHGQKRSAKAFRIQIPYYSKPERYRVRCRLGVQLIHVPEGCLACRHREFECLS